jgi:hypothetical protein
LADRLRYARQGFRSDRDPDRYLMGGSQVADLELERLADTAGQIGQLSAAS